METFLENTEVHYEMTVRNVGGYHSWNEKIKSDKFGVPDPSTDEEAFYMANQILTVWNDTIQSWEQPRELVNVQRVETKVIDLINQNQ
jgi:hypothetical protein